jgi:hypothetical protein
LSGFASDDPGKIAVIASSFASFQTPKYGGQTIAPAARSSKAFQRLLRIAAVPTAAFLVFAFWFAVGWGGSSAINALRFAGGLGFPAFAAVCAAFAARRGHGRHRQAWLVMTFGLAALEFGSITVQYHRIVRGGG